MRIATISLQRTGQHLIIDFFGRGLEGSYIHFNNCTALFFGSSYFQMKTGRRIVYNQTGPTDLGRSKIHKYLPFRPVENSIVSFENQSLSCRSLEQFDVILLIERDRKNWLSSIFAHQGLRAKTNLTKVHTAMKNFKRLQENLKIARISFDEFVKSDSYRRALAKKYNLDFDIANQAMLHRPDFGGGSSFQNSPDTVLDRYSESDYKDSVDAILAYFAFMESLT